MDTPPRTGRSISSKPPESYRAAYRCDPAIPEQRDRAGSPANKPTGQADARVQTTRDGYPYRCLSNLNPIGPGVFDHPRGLFRRLPSAQKGRRTVRGLVDLVGELEPSSVQFQSLTDGIKGRTTLQTRNTAAQSSTEVRHGGDTCTMILLINSKTKTHLTSASSHLPFRYCCPNRC